MTPGNAAWVDPVEESGAPLYRVVRGQHGGALKPESVSTKQERIAKLARDNLARALFSLNHYLDYECVKSRVCCKFVGGMRFAQLTPCVP